MAMTRLQAIDFLLTKPALFGHLVGFERLEDIHNGWICEMVSGKDDATLQAHRGSYKTTCVSLALAIIMILKPNCHTMFLRKTDTDVKEVIKQVAKILEDAHTRYFVQVIYGISLKLITKSTTELSTNLCNDIKGTAQLVGTGIGSSLTGKHFDKIFTDDIVNLSDRTSRAERERTKAIYQELQNIKNRGGRIYNTGTPWHKDDCFVLMPNPSKFDCYTTGLISDEEIEHIKGLMLPSLFAANYELRHIASEDVIFTSPVTGAEPCLVEQGNCHIDAAYGGADFTAFTIMRFYDGKYYVLGKCWQRSIQDVLEDIIALKRHYNAGKCYVEDNADKGYLARDIKNRGERVRKYHESMNKFVKITTYLKAVWNDVVFVQGTDEEYIAQICDFNENAEHDDCPDSLASLIRAVGSKEHSDYVPLWNNEE